MDMPPPWKVGLTTLLLVGGGRIYSCRDLQFHIYRSCRTPLGPLNKGYGAVYVVGPQILAKPGLCYLDLRTLDYLCKNAYLK
jgi:hypothetical protein